MGIVHARPRVGWVYFSGCYLVSITTRPSKIPENVPQPFPHQGITTDIAVCLGPGTIQLVLIALVSASIVGPQKKSARLHHAMFLLSSTHDMAYK